MCILDLQHLLFRILRAQYLHGLAATVLDIVLGV